MVVLRPCGDGSGRVIGGRWSSACLVLVCAACWLVLVVVLLPWVSLVSCLGCRAVGDGVKWALQPWLGGERVGSLDRREWLRQYEDSICDQRVYAAVAAESAALVPWTGRKVSGHDYASRAADVLREFAGFHPVTGDPVRPVRAVASDGSRLDVMGALRAEVDESSFDGESLARSLDQEIRGERSVVAGREVRERRRLRWFEWPDGKARDDVMMDVAMFLLAGGVAVFIVGLVLIFAVAAVLAVL